MRSVWAEPSSGPCVRRAACCRVAPPMVVACKTSEPQGVLKSVAHELRATAQVKDQEVVLCNEGAATASCDLRLAPREAIEVQLHGTWPVDAAAWVRDAAAASPLDATAPAISTWPFHPANAWFCSIPAVALCVARAFYTKRKEDKCNKFGHIEDAQKRRA